MVHSCSVTGSAADGSVQLDPILKKAAVGHNVLPALGRGEGYVRTRTQLRIYVVPSFQSSQFVQNFSRFCLDSPTFFRFQDKSLIFNPVLGITS